MRKRSKNILLVVFVLIALWWSAWYVRMWTQATSKTSTVPQPIVREQPDWEETTEDTYATISPRSIDSWQSLTLIWTVVSNEFATVYARRSWIIKDLYVDIWDRLEENQTIWELLPPGDVGQSSANIYEKQVRVQEAQANVSYMEKVAEQMVEKASLDRDLQALDGETASVEMIEKIQTDIASNQRELEQLRRTHQQQLKKITDDIEQEKEQLPVLIASIIQTLEHIMLGGDHNTISLSTDDLRKDLWIKNTAQRRDSLDAYRQLSLSFANYDWASIDELVEQTNETIELFLQMIEYSSSSSRLTQSMLEEFTQMLYSKQTMLLDKQEMIHDLENLYTTTRETQNQSVIQLENMIAKWEASLWEKTAVLETAYEKADQQLDLVTAEQELKLQQARNMLEIARANLSKEYVSSGNEKIITPFGGTVSKRMVQVGDVVSMWMPLYELIDVPTSLSKNAKREVHFGLPEEYVWVVDLWDVIQFTTAQNTSIYTWTIHRISPQVDQMSKTVTIQAVLDESVTLPHNSRVNVTLGMIKQQSYQLPVSVLTYADGEAYVPVLQEDGDVERRAVTVLADDGEFADIQWDIDESTPIVADYTW